MIPKIIHFVWLGGGKYPPPVQDCINSWKKIMPDYTIKRWDETTFDIDSVPWVKEAIQLKNGLWLRIISDILLFILRAVFIWIQM